jgi:glycosyltransferase involved in cell wall biosynthesis
VQLSVVVRSRNEADRLRLTLVSLQAQTQPCEIIVVNDGSSDHTSAVLAETGMRNLRIVTHSSPVGRSSAANAGASSATGEILLFLDGDTLAAPDLVERHLAAHRAFPNLVGRGETYHIRKTRFLKDPETATPQPEHEERLARMNAEERERLRVTRHQILADFQSIEGCAGPGVYPGAGPRRLYELEMDVLNNHTDCPVLWAAASGSNLSVGRSLFEKVGGFDSALDINEHRELALRLCEAGGRIRAVLGARTYHLTHRAGWRDPLQDMGWENTFFERHPLPDVKLLSVFWASLSDSDLVPPSARITTLPALAAASRSENVIDYEGIRRRIYAPRGKPVDGG